MRGIMVDCNEQDTEIESNLKLNELIDLRLQMEPEKFKRSTLFFCNSLAFKLQWCDSDCYLVSREQQQRHHS
jgi:hypothetical protein